MACYKLVPRFILIFSTFAISSYQNESIWRNLEEFYGGGWYSNMPVDYPGTHFDFPSSLNIELSSLDAGSSLGIWSGSEQGNYYNFWLDLNASDPEFCGLTEAKVIIRHFTDDWGNNETGLRFWPCAEAEDLSCFIPGSRIKAWDVSEVNVNTTAAFNYSLRLFSYGQTFLSLLDEIKLVHNGGNC